MKSIDTNILLYAINSDCPEHEKAKHFIRDALSEPGGWVVAEQVWFELYRLLRNPSVLRNPLGARQATDAVSWYRGKSGWLSCAWEPEMMERLLPFWRDESIPAGKSFDLILAISLSSHGVDTLYTRNTEDFAPLGLLGLHNPID